MFAKYICAHYAQYGISCINLEPHAIIENPPPQFSQNFKSLSPMQRTCSVDEISNFIVDLLLSKCHYINGETIKIDGGWSVL